MGLTASPMAGDLPVFFPLEPDPITSRAMFRVETRAEPRQKQVTCQVSLQVKETTLNLALRLDLVTRLHSRIHPHRGMQPEKMGKCSLHRVETRQAAVMGHKMVVGLVRCEEGVVQILVNLNRPV
ncbi:hypothetical protein SDC9_95334 [bioreactor metagenome]|uniref:Uncharacterized protein n=1 Tax=bioreactor metagenome TaxID=1076179 RepID=A0A645A7D6_9ZZZZ